jgi:hypothetical protein
MYWSSLYTRAVACSSVERWTGTCVCGSLLLACEAFLWKGVSNGSPLNTCALQFVTDRGRLLAGRVDGTLGGVLPANHSTLPDLKEPATHLAGRGHGGEETFEGGVRVDVLHVDKQKANQVLIVVNM